MVMKNYCFLFIVSFFTFIPQPNIAQHSGSLAAPLLTAH